MFVEASGHTKEVSRKTSDSEPLEAKSNAVDTDKPDSKSHLSGRNGEKASGSGPLNNLQELTLSYMCENPKMGFLEKEVGGKNFLEAIERARGKGKEIAEEEGEGEEDRRWVERDFLQFSGGGGGGNSKRGALDGGDGDFGGGEKRVKVETLSLCLAPPSLSLSLNSSDPVAKPVAAPPHVEVPTTVMIKRSQSNNTFNTRASSDDFGVSPSQSFSHAFSHNPSCSLTRNSTEFEYSKETDHIWYAGGGEGTNGSVHSRFKPIGENNNSITLSNHNGYTRLQSNNNREISNGFHRVNSFDNNSFFPLELPAKPRKELVKDVTDGIRNSMLTRPEKILGEILSESVPVVAQTLQELPSGSVEATKDYLRTLMNDPDKKEDFSNMQRRLERRSDLTFDTLLKSHKTQLDILVSVRTGLDTYLSMSRLPTKELVEIFLLTRCRNVNCKNILPIDDCDCKVCLNKKGFCSSCMCPVCMNFDCAQNTCSWVGCDVCSHWCHATCGIEKNLIRPGPSLKGAAGMSEMQFHCLGCGHASEMFGFVKDVFICCAKDWGFETLKKELDCVRRIFRGSEDYKGKELQNISEVMLTMLGKNLVSTKDASDVLLRFLKYGVSDLSTNGRASKDVMVATPLTVAPSKPTLNGISSPGASLDGQKTSLKAFEPSAQASLLKTDGFESLESLIQFKQAEAGLFQRLADEARKEVESYRQIVRAKSEKLENEYSSKLSKLCLQETDERRCKKLEELKVLENSRCDYFKMKRRMESEMANLLERMESTKQKWS